MGNEATLSIVARARDNASKTLKGLSGTIEKNQKQIRQMGIAFAATGAAISAFGVIASKSFMQFEGGMREVNTMLNLSEEAFRQLSEDVMDLARRLGVDAVESTKALYQAISAGVPKDNVISFMEIATKAAIGGVTSTEVAVDGLTTVINAFKMPMSEAQTVADLMFTAVKRGKTTFSELASTMSTVAPMAATLGIGFEEVTAVVATLTKQGVPTSQAMTQIRGAMVALMKPSAEMEKLLDKVGYASGQAAFEALGFAGTMSALSDASEGNNAVLAEAMGRVEGLNALLGITGQNAAGATEDLEAMADATDGLGAAIDAYEQVNKGAARQADMLKAQFQSMTLTIGSVLIPIITKVINKVSVVIEYITDWMKENKGLAAAIIIATTAMGGLLLALGGLLLMLPGIVHAAPLVGAAFHTMLGPMGLVTLAITGLIAAGIALKMNWDKVTSFIETQWENLKTVFLQHVSAMVDALDTLIGWLPILGDKVSDAKEAIDNMIDDRAFKRKADAVIESSKTMFELLEEYYQEAAEAAKIAAEETLADQLRDIDERRSAEQTAYAERLQEIREEYGILDEESGDSHQNQMEQIKEEVGQRKDALDAILSNDEDAFEARMLLVDEEFAKKIRLINDEYKARLTLLDAETQATIQKYQDEIDDLDDLTDAENTAAREKREQERKEELQRRVAAADTADDKADAQKDLDDYLAELAVKADQRQRKIDKDILRDKIQDVRDEALEKEKAIKEEIANDIIRLQEKQDRELVTTLGIIEDARIAEEGLAAMKLTIQESNLLAQEQALELFRLGILEDEETLIARLNLIRAKLIPIYEGGTLNTEGGATVIPTTSEGGIATRPQIRSVAENSSEAIIPLDRLGEFTGGDTVVYVYLDGKEIAKRTSVRVAREAKLQGIGS